MKIISLLLIGLFAAGCSGKPVLYHNAKYNSAGEDTAQGDVDECMDRADKAGAKEDKLAKSAVNAGKGAAVGAASGAVGSAIYGGNVGRGVGAGAAAGATGTFLWGILDFEPDPVYKNFVYRCLRDKGYDPIGWKTF